MRLSELIDILLGVKEERGDKDVTAGQLKAGDAIVLTVIIPNGNHAPTVDVMQDG